MRIGLIPGARRDTMELNATIQQVVKAEKDGFDHVWFPQISSFGFDALTIVSMAGALTSRIELGTAVIPTFPTHPLVLAKHALTAQAACSGRLALGLGLSHRPSIEDTMGLSYRAPVRHMREYLSVVRSLTSQGSADFSGEDFNVKAELNVPGSSPMPLVIAALAPRMLRLAGEMADGTVTWMAGVKTVGTHISPRINAAAQAAGRPQPRVIVCLPVAVTDDSSLARERAARTYERYGQLTNYRRLLDIEGVEGPSEVTVVGNEAQVEQQLRDFASAGATDFVASILPVDQDREASFSRSWELLRRLVGKV
ncbi:MAG: TIGR03564 family F420-dependent LLM class oxidoreductase [Chloroflexi bacterium]|nr:TIGR03564 family F420-dependent LLM class oxidoreductase [Chloroflexota bacterium]